MLDYDCMVTFGNFKLSFSHWVPKHYAVMCFHSQTRIFIQKLNQAFRPCYQSGGSPKVVALFSATNFSNYIIELLQLHDTIQIKRNYAWIHYDIAMRSQLMI